MLKTSPEACKPLHAFKYSQQALLAVLILKQVSSVNLSLYDTSIKTRVCYYNLKPLPTEIELILALKELEMLFPFWDKTFLCKGCWKRWPDDAGTAPLASCWTCCFATPFTLFKHMMTFGDTTTAPGHLMEKISRNYPWMSVVAPGDPQDPLNAQLLLKQELLRCH